MGEPLPETRWGAGRQSGNGSSNDSPGLYLVFFPGQNTGVWPPRASWSLSSKSISCGCGSPGRASWRRWAATQRMEMGREAVALTPSSLCRHTPAVAIALLHLCGVSLSTQSHDHLPGIGGRRGCGIRSGPRGSGPVPKLTGTVL